MHRRHYIALTGLAVAGLAGCAEESDGETQVGSANDGAGETGSTDGSGGNVEDKVTLQNHEWYNEGQLDVGVRGQLKNISSSELDYVEVKVVFLDADGVQIGDNFDNVTDLAAGRTWQFDMLFLGDDPETVETYEITPSLSAF